MDSGLPRLGAVWDGSAVHFALFSRHATAVELCLFDNPEAARESRRLPLRRTSGGVWRLSLPGIAPGQLYGYRVSGPYEPQNGHRFNPAKLLVDPYALAVTGEPRYGTALFAFDPRAAVPELSFNSEDSARLMPRSVVVDPAFDWGDDRPPRTPWSETVIYEAHVRGLTRLHPEVPEPLRGTYLGLAQPPVLDHLRRLGVTAVELLPIHQIASERHLLESGRRNYWGYSPLAYLAPHAGYASGGLGEQVREFKTLVRELHRAGIEVILDVVFNHTAEGGPLGPTLSLRGIDNRSYYRLEPRSRDHYADTTGCGNTLDLRQPAALQLVLASLRYWVKEMHVDGFRFDLAPALARTGGAAGTAFDPRAPFFAAIADDPDLAQVKLIAEPWDLGPGGYQLAGFPPTWAVWNDRYRNAVRRFWRGDPGVAAELARRVAGSVETFGPEGFTRSLHYVTCHDGFTLKDLVSYERKHNEANGEDGRDGTSQNLSRGWGQEGPSGDPAIRAARARAQRNLLATLVLSRGVPMLLHGDELGRSQGGNNNAYCQDNAVSWVDWSPSAADDLTAFVARLLALRRRWGQGFEQALVSLRQDGGERSDAQEPDPSLHTLALYRPAAAGVPAGLLLLNAGEPPFVQRLPRSGWHLLLDTAAETPEGGTHRDEVVVAGFSLQLLETIEA